MKKRALVLVGVMLGGATVCVPRQAFALGPVDVEVGARIGAGTNPFSDPIPNPLGFGIGARGGVDFSNFYAGVLFMYYLGSSQNIAGLNFSLKSIQYGVEGGYGTTLAHLITLRGQLGVGNLQIQSAGDQSNGAGYLYLEPGVTALVSLGLLFVGADANILILPDAADPRAGSSSWRTAFTAHAQVGVTF